MRIIYTSTRVFSRMLFLPHKMEIICPATPVKLIKNQNPGESHSDGYKPVCGSKGCCCHEYLGQTRAGTLSARTASSTNSSSIPAIKLARRMDGGRSSYEAYTKHSYVLTRASCNLSQNQVRRHHFVRKYKERFNSHIIN